MTIENPEDRADTLLDGMPDDYLRGLLRDGKTRGDFARVAMAITEDRYGAGSTAARAILAILLRHGLEAAAEFLADLEHHES